MEEGGLRAEVARDPNGQDEKARLRERWAEVQDQQDSDRRAELQAVIKRQRAEALDEATLVHLDAMEALAQKDSDALHGAWAAQQDALQRLRDIEKVEFPAKVRQIQLLELQEERNRLLDESAKLKEARAQIEIAGRVIDQDGRPVQGARRNRLRLIERAAAPDIAERYILRFDPETAPDCPPPLEAPVVTWATPKCPRPPVSRTQRTEA